ncbi:TonB-dependent receptor [Steroidobacter sp.]|uniref:TonB-dependent receptor n=1 Tax=Steroidobacter sp. TaxID=1978227 RepID=UPI001A416279|nr:TonB-dependent receptor [Steroidobacter sp.]MBL8266498.1 TonB-dependent receptor [Steroidobacter sp.]
MKVRFTTAPRLAALAGSLFLSTLGPVTAQDLARARFDIEQQSLSSALNECARQAGREILFAPNLVQSLQTEGVRGEYTVTEALDRLLKGTNLRFRVTGEDTILIESASSAGSTSASAQDLSLADMELITVFGRGVAAESIREVPQTATVLGEELLEIIPNATVQDALRFIPSASNLIGDYSFTHNFNIRGFGTSATWNGMVPGIAAPNKIDSTNVERIEVLMGPAAVLYGAMEPGAVINVVTKQPQRAFHAELNVNGGSYDTYGASLDIGGPLSDRIAARLNASYSDAGAPFDHWGLQTIFLAPVVSFELSERTLLTVEGTYRDAYYDEGIYDGRIPVAGTLRPNPNGEIPIDTNPGYVAGVTDFTALWKQADVRLKHEFSDALTLNAQLSYADNSLTSVEAFGGNLQSNNRTVTRTLGTRDQQQENYLAAVNLGSKFSTGAVEHAVTVGFDYIDYQADTVNGGYSGVMPVLDVYAPNYSVTGPLTFVPNFFFTGKLEAFAGYLQDRIKIGDDLTLLVGTRYTDSESKTALTPPGLPRTDLPLVKASKWSTQLGVLYDVTDSVSVYANRTTSFQPREAVLSRTGEVLDTPETAVQYELGTHLELGGPGLIANLALFRIEKPNVRTPDPENTLFQIQAGEVRSQGVELSVNGQLLPNWMLYGAYAFTDTEVVKTNVANQLGKRFRNAPEHTASLVTRYDIASGLLEGLGFSAAVNYIGSRYAEAVNILELPASTRVDLGVYYDVNEHVEVSLRGSNITDEDIYNGFSTTLVMRNAGASYTANMKVRF